MIHKQIDYQHILASIVDGAEYAVIGKSLTGEIISWNKAAEKIYGYSAEEVLGKNCAFLLPDDRKQEAEQYLRKIRNGETIEELETIRVNKDGARTEVFLRVSPIKSGEGEIIGASTISCNINVLDQYKRKLNDEKELAKVVIDNVIDGIITIDISGIIQTFNPAAEQIFGYQANEVIGQNVKMLMPEPFQAEHDNYLQNYLKTGKAKIIGIGREVVGLKKNGAQFPLELSIGEAHLEDKTMFTGIVKDISERKIFENKLLEKQTRIEAVLNNTIDGIITIDKRGKIKDFNPAAERIFGYLAEEVIGRNVKMLMPEPYSSQHDSYLKNYLETGHAKIIGIGREVIGLRRNGTTFPLELGISVMESEGQPMFIGITRDISDQKMAVDAREQLASIVENTEDAIWGQQMDGTITFWNNAAKKIFGYSDFEIMGKGTHILVPKDRQAEYSYILEKIKRGETLNSFETQMQKKDGKGIHVSLTVSPIYDGKGEIIGASTIARDISDHVFLLKEKEDLIHQLECVSLIDPLTNLLNRRGMVQRLEYEHTRYRRFGVVYSLVLADIDFFKRVNDTYGHLKGDEVLKFVSEILKSNCREQDSVARWGGEEFLILLVQTQKEGGLSFTSKLLESIQKSCFKSGEISINITFSMGLVSVNQGVESLEQLLNKADQYLYQAKKEGRNRVVA